MVFYCSVAGCKNHQIPHGVVKFHRYPLKNQNLLSEWLKVIPARQTNFTPKKCTVICNVHFTENDYYMKAGSRKTLRPDAIPSIFGRKTTSLNITKRELQNTVSGTPTEEFLRRKVKLLQDQLKYQNKRINHLMTILAHFRNIGHGENSLSKVLTSLKGFSRELFIHIYKNRSLLKQRRYSNNIKQFALTLHHYSPRAYKFLCDKLCLPSAAKLNDWRLKQNKFYAKVNNGKNISE